MFFFLSAIEFEFYPRNWLLDDGFYLDPEIEEKLGKPEFIKLLDRRGSTEGITIIPKVNLATHILLKEQDRQERIARFYFLIHKSHNYILLTG